MTRRFWEKTRETPDHAIGRRQETGLRSVWHECRLGSLFFHSSPSRRCAIRQRISPKSLHEGISPSDKTASLGHFRSSLGEFPRKSLSANPESFRGRRFARCFKFSQAPWDDWQAIPVTQHYSGWLSKPIRGSFPPGGVQNSGFEDPKSLALGFLRQCNFIAEFACQDFYGRYKRS
jgi:hypothetical protein